MINYVISDENLIEILLGNFRDILNIIVNRHEENEPPLLALSQKLKNIATRQDWYEICAAMDLMRDSQLAKDNFKQFELEGPTKYNELGEKYLRLFGILNAVNLQRHAIISIAKFSNHGNVKKLKDELADSEIVELRHMAASHNLGYNDNENINVNMTVRNELNGTRVGTFSMNNRIEVIDVQEKMAVFDKIIIRELFDSVERLLAITPNESERKQEVKKRHHHIRNFLKGESYCVQEGSIFFCVGEDL